MSYILDALRKADAERELGTPADPLMAMPSAPVAAAPEPRPARTWIWLAAGAAIPLAAWLAWRLAPEADPEPAPRAATAPQRNDAPQAVATAAPAAPATESAPTPTAVPTPAAQAVPPETAAGPAPAQVARPAPARPAPPRPAVPAKRPEARNPEAQQARAQVRTLAELPDELRRLVPAMTIGGSVYSPQPEARMLVVNGQVVREGTALTPELRLESIGRQTAVFSIRGQRFEVRL